jgi:hypothetical protein
MVSWPEPGRTEVIVGAVGTVADNVGRKMKRVFTKRFGDPEPALVTTPDKAPDVMAVFTAEGFARLFVSKY